MNSEEDDNRLSTMDTPVNTSPKLFFPENQQQRDVTNYEKSAKTENLPSSALTVTKELEDNVSTANGDVVLRHPLTNYQTLTRPTSTIKHSSSTSDIVRLRQFHGRPLSKDSKGVVVLPVLSTNRSPNSAFYSINPNYQESFSPYIPLEPGNSKYSSGVFFVDSEDGKPPLTPLSPTNSHSHNKLPTPPELKKKAFMDILTTSMSKTYAILIVTLGISFYIIDFLQIENEDVNLIAEGFSLFLLSIALLYLLYLILDIIIYNNRKRKFDKLMGTIEAQDIELTETHQGVSYNVKLQKALSLKKRLDHRYCFNLDRHSSNFYLKIGAAGFCFGHLIHSILILTYRGLILGSSETTTPECMSVVSFIIEILYPIYSILLLFFIFKYSNVIINKNRDFHRFGFMHCLSASLCFWIWTIFRETAEYIQNSQYPDDYNSTTELVNLNAGLGVPYRFTVMCEHEELNVIYQNYSPYLYPFSVEYSILVVGIIYIVWVNIGLCSSEQEQQEHHGEDTRECRNERRPSEPESNITIHADCHASNKGLFSGFIVLVFSIVSLILFFITNYSQLENLAETGLLVNQSTHLVIMVLMIIAVVFAYIQIIKLDINEAAHNSLDNFLCLMCLPAFFVHGTFSLIPGIIYGNVVAVISIILEIVQVVIQTTFIIDGMARASNSKSLRKKKFGREFVTFLVICNVAMWLMQTFEVKSHGLDQYRQDFYSRELWSVIGHMCLPLMMFYRFHSSACLGDIWKYSYMPSGH